MPFIIEGERKLLRGGVGGLNVFEGKSLLLQTV